LIVSLLLHCHWQVSSFALITLWRVFRLKKKAHLLVLFPIEQRQFRSVCTVNVPWPVTLCCLYLKEVYRP
jgi:hypothetical protein